MKIQFIKENGEVVETTVTELSVWLFDGSINGYTSGQFINRLYDFVEEKQQEDENSLHARLRNVQHDDTRQFLCLGLYVVSNSALLC